MVVDVYDAAGRLDWPDCPLMIAQWICKPGSGWYWKEREQQTK